MTVTLGGFTMDTASGNLLPARGIEVIPQPDPDPPVVDLKRALAVPSTIETARAVVDEAAAIALAASYYDAVGAVVVFRGVYCFCANVQVRHRAALASLGGGALVEATWTLYASTAWIPT